MSRFAAETRHTVVALPPAPDTVLTCREVADYLKLTPRQVQRLGIPFIDCGLKNRRYLGRDVLAWLEQRRRLDGHKPLP